MTELGCKMQWWSSQLQRDGGTNQSWGAWSHTELIKMNPFTWILIKQLGHQFLTQGIWPDDHVFLRSLLYFSVWIASSVHPSFRWAVVTRETIGCTWVASDNTSKRRVLLFLVSWAYSFLSLFDTGPKECGKAFLFIENVEGNLLRKTSYSIKISK